MVTEPDPPPAWNALGILLTLTPHFSALGVTTEVFAEVQAATEQAAPSAIARIDARSAECFSFMAAR